MIFYLLHISEAAGHYKFWPVTHLDHLLALNSMANFIVRVRSAKAAKYGSNNTAKVGPTATTHPIAETAFICGAATQGLINLIWLSIGAETLAQWSQRIYGSIVSHSEDADDHDHSNSEEYLASTDPLNPTPAS